MRPIKFRAWDTLKERMVEVCGIDFSNGLPSVIHTKALSPVIETTNRYILMQFTGLLDKNGKEIYEGDVVRFVDAVVQVVFAQDKLYLTGGKYYTTGWYALKTDNTLMFPLEGGGGEIIGNIYENSELLK